MSHSLNHPLILLIWRHHAINQHVVGIVVLFDNLIEVEEFILHLVHRNGEPVYLAEQLNLFFCLLLKASLSLH